MKEIKIGFIGSGWRAQGYMRVIREFGHRMSITGILVRSDKSFAEMNGLYPGIVTKDTEEFLKGDYDFVMVMVPGNTTCHYIHLLAQAGIPALSETPAGITLEELNAVARLQKETGAKIQVTEQCYLRPYYQAVLRIIQEGYLGRIVNINQEILHDYHAMSIIRKCFGIHFENAVIEAKKYVFPVQYHCGREGLHVHSEDDIVQDPRKRADISFETGQVAFYDFSDEQYFNYFRRRRLNIRGIKGEISDYSVSFLGEDGYPVIADIIRDEIGQYENLEGCGLRSLTFMGKPVYRNPYLQEDVRLNDDEIAMAVVLDGMKEYVDTGKPIDPLKEALQDTYLMMTMNESIAEGKTLTTKTQSWGE